MMHRSSRFPGAAACALLALLASAPASAAPIAGLFNTGEGFSQNQQDTNYRLSKTGGDGPALGSFGYVTQDAAFPVGIWLPNTAESRWLTPLDNQGASLDNFSNGVYTWTLEFDLTGFDAATASFTGRWATDNSGQILLNGGALQNPSTGFTSYSAFSSAGGNFVSGINTLEFVVTNFAQNGGNPTGIRVEFLSSDVALAAVPAPAPLGVLFAAMALVGLRRAAVGRFGD